MAKEQNKKNRSGRRSYLKDFKKGPDGKYAYTGTVYEPAAEITKKTKGSLLLFALCGAALSVLSGCIPAGGNSNCYYVILPYVFEVAFVFLGLWKVISWLTAEKPLREYVYRSTVMKFSPYGLLTAVFAGTGLACMGLYVLLNGTEGKTVGILICGICKLGTLYSGISVKKSAAKLPYIAAENGSDDE